MRRLTRGEQADERMMGDESKVERRNKGEKKKSRRLREEQRSTCF